MATTPTKRTSDIERLSVEISSLQKDVQKIGPLVDRLDVTIDKLTNVANDVSKLLAVQDNRIGAAEKALLLIQESAEKRRESNDNNFKDLAEHLEAVKAGLEKNRSHFTEKLNTLDVFNKSIEDRITKVETRLTNLEKWRWLIAGAAGVFAFLVGNAEHLASIMAGLAGMH